MNFIKGCIFSALILVLAIIAKNSGYFDMMSEIARARIAGITMVVIVVFPIFGLIIQDVKKRGEK